MTDITTEQFSLGPGTLYIADGGILESDLESPEYKLGDTEGGCALAYTYNTKELLDLSGEVAGIIRYGEKFRLSGKLCRVSPAPLSAATSDGCKGGRSRLSVLFVCPLPNGESLRLFAYGGVPADFTYNASYGGVLRFEFVYGKNASHPKFCLAGETFTEGSV